MARDPRRATTSADFDVDALSSQVAARFDDVPWHLFDSKDLASSGETRFMASRIQTDLLKLASVDRLRAAQIWEKHVPDFVPRPEELPERQRIEAPVNAIEPARRRRKVQAEPYLDTVTKKGRRDREEVLSKSSDPKEPGPSAPSIGPLPEPVLKDGKDAKDGDRQRLLIDGLNKLYLKADDKYHFRDKTGEIAFEAQEKKLVTQHDTPSVVSSMIDLAETRGWSSLKLTGTAEFRREAWLQANLRGLNVSGYQPTKLDKARLEDLRSERASSEPMNSMSDQTAKSRTGMVIETIAPIIEDGRPEPKIPLTGGQDQALRAMEATMRHRGDGPEAIARARALANERLTSERIHVGKLMEVGTAPYQDRHGEKLSHFVTLENGQGERTKVWGMDLPRAITESGAQEGELVAVAFKGRQTVTVDVPIKDGVGKFLRTERQTVDRNRWDVVPFDKLKEDAKQSVLVAAERQHGPAKIQVFDRAAQPAKPIAPFKPDRSRPRERSI